MRAGPEPVAAPWWGPKGLRSLVLLAATMLALYLCWRIIQPFVAAVTWALALAVAAHPLHRRIARNIRNGTLAALVSLLLVALMVAGPGFLLARQIVREATQAANWVRSQTEAGDFEAAVARVPVVGPLVKGWIEEADLREEGKRLAGAVTARVSAFVAESAWVLTQFVITLLTLFFLFRDSTATISQLSNLLPLSASELDTLIQRVSDVIAATLYGKFAAAGAQGLLGGLMLWVLDFHAPLLWGAAMAASSIIPMMGPFLVWVPAAIYLAVTGALVKALILTLWGVFAVGMVDNIVYPIVVGERLQMHTLIVFFAAFGGVMTFGISGIVLGPVVLAVTLGLIEIWKLRGLSGQET